MSASYLSTPLIANRCIRFDTTRTRHVPPYPTKPLTANRCNPFDSAMRIGMTPPGEPMAGQKSAPKERPDALC